MAIRKLRDADAKRKQSDIAKGHGVARLGKRFKHDVAFGDFRKKFRDVLQQIPGRILPHLHRRKVPKVGSQRRESLSRSPWLFCSRRWKQERMGMRIQKN